MPLLKSGRLWSKQALEWSSLHLTKKAARADWNEPPSEAITCARAGCNTNPRIAPHVQSGFFYEGRDVCSRECAKLMIAAEVLPAFQATSTAHSPYVHRMPLGLLMLSRRWITHDQLLLALRRQRETGSGRLGDWLVATGACDEQAVARGVAAQWGIPVMLAQGQSPEVVGMVPQLLSEAFSAFPVRIAAQRILYLAVEQQIHPSLNVAIEKMTGLNVRPVLLRDSGLQNLKANLSSAPSFHGRLFRSRSASDLCTSILSMVDEAPTQNLQVTTLGGYAWLRLLRKSYGVESGKIEDVIFLCAAREQAGSQPRVDFASRASVRKMSESAPAFGH